jgi:hypothetical protein
MPIDAHSEGGGMTSPVLQAWLAKFDRAKVEDGAEDEALLQHVS